VSTSTAERESAAAWGRRQLALAAALKSVPHPRRAIPLAELHRIRRSALKAAGMGDADAWAREKAAERRAYEDHVCSTTGQLCRCKGREGAKVEPDPAEDLRAGRRYLQARLDVERARLAIRANIYTSGA
jgi:hypothetical protein